ncbi:heterokaryon incompatibility protein-domain-containing protein [Bisporella sp. PMI_857]|nr:heterokaryon incompatibility protein-domain-containing protein [Bisporella sp. PMI_857]
MSRSAFGSAVSHLYSRCYDFVIDSPARLAHNACVYNALDTAKDEFRLLHLHSGPRGSAIAASLVTHSLSQPPQYDALSYVWGPPRLSASITVDGAKIYITRHLRRCLQHLRLEGIERVIWIDAVCINQSDLNERNHQVMLMEQIYRGANTVRVWMDIKIDITQPAFYKMLHFPGDSSEHCLGDDTEFWLPLEPFFTNSYWNRVWVQQELILSRHSVFHCRDDELDGDKVGEFLDLVGKRGRQEESSGLRMQWHDLLSRFDIHALTKIVSPRKRILWRDEELRRGSTGKDGGLRLIHLLSSMSRLKTTDPRDRVFALLPLAHDRNLLTSAGLTVNYSKSVTELYTDLAIANSANSGNLDFLEFVTKRGRRFPELPSWVPDWSDMTQPLISSPSTRRADAHVGQPAKLSLSAEGAIRVLGFPISQIALVFELKVFPKTLGDILCSLSIFCNEALTVLEAVNRTTDDTFRDVVRHIISSENPNLLPEYYSKEANLLQSLKNIATGLSPFSNAGPDFIRGESGPDIPVILKQVIGHIISAAIYKDLAFTSDGLPISTYDGCAAPGNEIWLILGCVLPMILRKPESDIRKVVGSCYVLELMDGGPLALICDEDAILVAERGLPEGKQRLVYEAAEEIFLK